ncbi:MAG: hypothetical protein LBG96_05925 [Tannerella sp.]|jgi:ligand-binding sensor domain-containing protein|nr:hypothetical protein [Tannerella sp.]
MKKIIFYMLLFITGSAAWAVKPSEWGILRSDYMYVNGSFNTTSPLRDHQILDMAVTSDNRLWILTNKGLYVLREQAKEFHLDSPLPIKQIPYQASKTPPHLYADSLHGSLVLQTSEQYWTTLDYQQWSVYPVQPENYSIDFSARDRFLTQASEMLLLPDGSYWVSGLFAPRPGITGSVTKTQGVMYCSPGKDPVLYLLPEEQARAARQREVFNFTDLHLAKNHTLWARGNQDGKGLWRLSAGEWKFMATNVSDITSGENGEIYFSTDESIYRIDSDDQTEEVAPARAHYMTVDKKGYLWFVPVQRAVSYAKPDVLVRYDLKTNTYFKMAAAKCPVEGAVRKIVVDSNNTKYILTENPTGIYIINDSKPQYEGWTVITAEYDTPEVLDENYWKALWQTQDGKYVALLQDKKIHLRSFQNGQWTPEGTYDRPPGFYEITDVFDKNGQMYFATNRGLYRLENGKSEPATEWDKKQFPYKLTAVARDSENNLWAGSDKGIAKFDGASYTFFNKKNTPALTEESIRAICIDRDNKLFFGTTGGLVVKDRDEWTFYDKKSGLNNKKVAALASDSRGKTFIVTTGLLGTAEVINIYEDGQLRQESLPEKILLKTISIDQYDNLWIAGTSPQLICRKSNGEYILFDSKNSPMPKSLLIRNMFIIGDELRLIIDESSVGRDDGLPKTTHAAGAFSPLSGPDAVRLNTFISPQQVLIYDITKQK